MSENRIQIGGLADVSRELVKVRKIILVTLSDMELLTYLSDSMIRKKLLRKLTFRV